MREDCGAGDIFSGQSSTVTLLSADMEDVEEVLQSSSTGDK